MKSSKFTETQIVAILKGSENGLAVADICRTHGISQATFSKWRSQYGGMDASLMKRLKELEAENARLKKMYADSELDKQILRESLAKTFESPETAVPWREKQCGIIRFRSSGLVGFTR